MEAFVSYLYGVANSSHTYDTTSGILAQLHSKPQADISFRLRKFRNSDHLREGTDDAFLDRWTDNSRARGFATLMRLLPFDVQPWLAIMGLAGTFSIFFVFSSSPWWGHTNATASEWFRFYLIVSRSAMPSTPQGDRLTIVLPANRCTYNVAVLQTFLQEAVLTET